MNWLVLQLWLARPWYEDHFLVIWTIVAVLITVGIITGSIIASVKVKNKSKPVDIKKMNLVVKQVMNVVKIFYSWHLNYSHISILVYDRYINLLFSTGDYITLYNCTNKSNKRIYKMRYSQETIEKICPGFFEIEKMMLDIEENVQNIGYYSIHGYIKKPRGYNSDYLNGVIKCIDELNMEYSLILDEKANGIKIRLPSKTE